MPRPVFAASFVDEADAIARYIEAGFGLARADRFIGELDAFCSLIADNPGLGLRGHGYDTQLHGVVFERNWIFFEQGAEEVRFLHIVDGRRAKAGIVC